MLGFWRPTGLYMLLFFPPKKRRIVVIMKREGVSSAKE
jgi:hypothetical protein